MVGILLIICTKKELTPRISLVEHDSIKLGFANSFGNKGSVLCKIKIDDTLLCFNNVHIPAGDTNFNQKI